VLDVATPLNVDAAKAGPQNCSKVTMYHFTVARDPITIVLSARPAMIAVGAGKAFK